MDVRSQPDAQRTPLAAGIDTAIVVGFVAIGRRNHHDSSEIAGIVETAVPFLVGLLVAWLATRAWRRPTDLGTGAVVWVVTVAVGMLVRRVVFDDGTATSFVVVATLFLGLLLAWRAVARLFARRTLAH